MKIFKTMQAQAQLVRSLVVSFVSSLVKVTAAQTPPAAAPSAAAALSVALASPAAVESPGFVADESTEVHLHYHGASFVTQSEGERSVSAIPRAQSAFSSCWEYSDGPLESTTMADIRMPVADLLNMNVSPAEAPVAPSQHGAPLVSTSVGYLVDEKTLDQIASAKSLYRPVADTSPLLADARLVSIPDEEESLIAEDSGGGQHAVKRHVLPVAAEGEEYVVLAVKTGGAVDPAVVKDALVAHQLLKRRELADVETQRARWAEHHRNTEHRNALLVQANQNVHDVEWFEARGVLGQASQDRRTTASQPPAQPPAPERAAAPYDAPPAAAAATAAAGGNDGDEDPDKHDKWRDVARKQQRQLDKLHRRFGDQCNLDSDDEDVAPAAAQYPTAAQLATRPTHPSPASPFQPADRQPPRLAQLTAAINPPRSQNWPFKVPPNTGAAGIPEFHAGPGDNFATWLFNFRKRAKIWKVPPTMLSTLLPCYFNSAAASRFSALARRLETEHGVTDTEQLAFETLVDLLSAEFQTADVRNNAMAQLSNIQRQDGKTISEIETIIFRLQSAAFPDGDPSPKAHVEHMTTTAFIRACPAEIAKSLTVMGVRTFLDAVKEARRLEGSLSSLGFYVAPDSYNAALGSGLRKAPDVRKNRQHPALRAINETSSADESGAEDARPVTAQPKKAKEKPLAAAAEAFDFSKLGLDKIVRDNVRQEIRQELRAAQAIDTRQRNGGGNGDAQAQQQTSGQQSNGQYGQQSNDGRGGHGNFRGRGRGRGVGRGGAPRDLSSVQCWNCQQMGHFQSSCANARVERQQQDGQSQQSQPTQQTDNGYARGLQTFYDTQGRRYYRDATPAATNYFNQAAAATRNQQTAMTTRQSTATTSTTTANASAMTSFPTRVVSNSQDVCLVSAFTGNAPPSGQGEMNMMCSPQFGPPARPTQKAELWPPLEPGKKPLVCVRKMGWDLADGEAEVVETSVALDSLPIDLQEKLRERVCALDGRIPCYRFKLFPGEACVSVNHVQTRSLIDSGATRSAMPKSIADAFDLAIIPLQPGEVTLTNISGGELELLGKVYTHLIIGRAQGMGWFLVASDADCSRTMVIGADIMRSFWLLPDYRRNVLLVGGPTAEYGTIPMGGACSAAELAQPCSEEVRMIGDSMLCNTSADGPCVVTTEPLADDEISRELDDLLCDLPDDDSLLRELPPDSDIYTSDESSFAEAPLDASLVSTSDELFHTAPSSPSAEASSSQEPPQSAPLVLGHAVIDERVKLPKRSHTVIRARAIFDAHVVPEADALCLIEPIGFRTRCRQNKVITARTCSNIDKDGYVSLMVLNPNPRPVVINARTSVGELELVSDPKEIAEEFVPGYTELLRRVQAGEQFDDEGNLIESTRAYVPPSTTAAQHSEQLRNIIAAMPELSTADAEPPDEAPTEMPPTNVDAPAGLSPLTGEGPHVLPSPTTQPPMTDAEMRAVFLDKFDFSEADSLLTEEEGEKLRDLVWLKREAFQRHSLDLGDCNVLKHSIKTGDARPIASRPYRIPIHLKGDFLEQIKNMVKLGVIVPSISPWASPVVLVKKSDGGIRICIDFRKLNAVTERDVFPLPRIEELLDTIGNAKILTSLDLAQGFHQIQIAEEDQAKTAFVSSAGLFQWVRMPFGVVGGPATFQRTMEVVLAGLHWVSCLCYLDDVLVFSPTFEEHLTDLGNVFDRFIKHNLRAKPKKCFFAREQIDFLGHVVGRNGLKPNPKKVEAVSDFPQPHDVLSLQRFLGLVNYYRRFINGFAKIAVPLYKLLRHDEEWNWTKECDDAFNGLKAALAAAPQLAFPDWHREFRLTTDASQNGLGAILSQVDDDGNERPVSFASRTLKIAELKWGCAIEWEALAILWGTMQNRAYLEGRHFTVITDHAPLKWLMQHKDANPRLMKWSLKLQGYSFTIQHKPGKDNQNADALSRAPVSHGAYGSLKALTHSEYRIIYDEYWEMPRWCDVRGNELGDVFDFDSVAWNSERAFLRSIGHDLLDRRGSLDRHFTLDEFKDEQRADTDLMEIIGKLQDATLHGRLSPSDVRRYVLKRGVLFFGDRRGAGRLRLVLPAKYRRDVLEAYHTSILGAHQGVGKTRATISRKYHWPRIHQDVEQFITRCHSCQVIKAGGTLSKSIPSQPIPVPQKPFWRIASDCLELTETENGNKYVIVFMDYLTKWVEAFAVPDIKGETLTNLLITQIIPRHGVPREFLSDRGCNYTSKVFRAACEGLGITNLYCTVAHAQTDGMVEKFNRTLCEMLALYVKETQRDWDTILDIVLGAYRMAIHTSTGESPFYLMYGRDAQQPVDLLFSTPRLTAAVEDKQKDERQREFATAWWAAKCKIERAQIAQKYYCDRGAALPPFRLGDLVLLRVRRVPRGRKLKLAHKWTGPFRITELTPTNAVITSVVNPKAIPKKMHLSQLKLYKSAAVLSFETDITEVPDGDDLPDGVIENDERATARPYADASAAADFQMRQDELLDEAPLLLDTAAAPPQPRRSSRLRAKELSQAAVRSFTDHATRRKAGRLPHVYSFDELIAAEHDSSLDTTPTLTPSTVHSDTSGSDMSLCSPCNSPTAADAEVSQQAE